MHTYYFFDIPFGYFTELKNTMFPPDTLYSYTIVAKLDIFTLLVCVESGQVGDGDSSAYK